MKLNVVCIYSVCYYHLLCYYDLPFKIKMSHFKFLTKVQLMIQCVYIYKHLYTRLPFLLCIFCLMTTKQLIVSKWPYLPCCIPSCLWVWWPGTPWLMEPEEKQKKELKQMNMIEQKIVVTTCFFKLEIFCYKTSTFRETATALFQELL